MAAVLPAAAARRRAVSLPPLDPPCTMITGTGSVAVTRNGGVSLIPSAEAPRAISYTYGVTVLRDVDDTLAAWNGDDLLISTDRGCSWRVAATVTGAEFPPSLTAAPGGRVYAWSENRRFLVRYDDRGVRTLKQPVDFMGLGVDAQNGDRLRAGGNDGSVWESLDAGETWTFVGRLEGAVGYYRFAFDPTDLDHVIAGTVAKGAWVSRDGGRSWTPSSGIGKGDANVFQIVFSPADANRVWAMGIDLAQSAEGHPSRGRHIYVSSDGGATFDAVIDERPGVKLINGPTMAAHPTNPGVLYFVFGTHVYQYGTDLFRFDLAAPDHLVLMHHDLDGINAIAFSPNDPDVMYLGVEEVQ